MPQRGSVFQRSNGRWVASIRVSGKMIQRYGASRADAERKLDDLLRDHFSGSLAAPTKLTLREWFGQWLDELELRPSTLRTYREVLTPVLNDVGGYRMDRLTSALLSLTFAKLAKKGMGARRRQLAHGYLKSCLGRAVELEVLARNPMLKVRRPEWQPKPRTYWSAEQAARFVRTGTAAQNRWAPLFVVLTTCGLRVSEALALRARDVDLEARALQVRRALVWSGSEHNEGDAKTRSSIRRLTLPAAAVMAFQRAGVPDEPDAPIFLTLRGNPPSPSHLRQPLLALCTAAAVPPLNIHGLRHVHAALVYHLTGDVYAVKARLGHSDVAFTMRQYGYGTGSDADTARAVDGLLGRGG
jgi:integrase